MINFCPPGREGRGDTFTNSYTVFRQLGGAFLISVTSQLSSVQNNTPKGHVFIRHILLPFKSYLVTTVRLRFPHLLSSLLRL